MSDCTDTIHDRVTEQIQSGIAVDVYQMAAALQKNCPGLTIEVIAQHVAAAVAIHRGNAVWDRSGKPNPNS
jgi:hypothetical protein